MNAATKRIVIIGRDGQVSRSLWDALHAAGHDVVRLGRPDIDLAHPESVAAAIRAERPEIVVCPAAYTAVDMAEDEPAVAEAINSTGAEAVAKAAAEAGAVIIHFSTDYVFDGRRSTPYVETDATGPIGVYGATKLAGERRVAAANPRHIILRTAWVCSPYGNNFVKTMLRLAGERPELRVVDDQRGNPTFAADLADVVRRLVPHVAEASALSASFGIFHVVNNGATTWCGLARAVMQGAAERGAPHVPVQPIRTVDYPTKASRPENSVLSTHKIEATHGIRLPHWETSLSACLDSLIGPVRGGSPS